MKFPVYHGARIKSDVWPHVVIYGVDGEILYNGKHDKKFDRALNKAIRDMKK